MKAIAVLLCLFFLGFFLPGCDTGTENKAKPIVKLNTAPYFDKKKIRPVLEPSDGSDAFRLQQPSKGAIRNWSAYFSGAEAGSDIARYLGIVASPGPDAGRRERVALAQLQKKPKKLKSQMVSELYVAYMRMEETDYYKKWLLVNTLGKLNTLEALDDLHKIAKSPIPKEKYKQVNGAVSSRAEESLIRFAAIRGISQYALNHKGEGEKLLFNIATEAKAKAVKNMAVQWYLYLPMKLDKMSDMEKYQSTRVYMNRKKQLAEVMKVDIKDLMKMKPAKKRSVKFPVTRSNVLKKKGEAHD